MEITTPMEPRRRELLRGGIAALAVLMYGARGSVQATVTAWSADPRFPLADRLGDLVIPATDTGGASTARVAAFLLMALDQQMCGMRQVMLEHVRADLDRRIGREFTAQSRTHQSTVLRELDADAFRQEMVEVGTSFHSWRRIKAAIVAGYYTSEIGASKELVFEPVPGSSSNIIMTSDYRSRSNQGFGGAF